MFTLLKTDPTSKARLGIVDTAHGKIESPFFMPVGTTGTVKSLEFADLHEINAQLVLSNTYHLYLRPGMEIMESAGGLHQFANWPKPILTDSGGYQVFSLSKLRKITDEGVKFQSHIDGSPQFFSPESVIKTQQIIGSDMMMPLDVCAPYPCKRKEAESSVERTTDWAKRSLKYWKENQDKRQYLFGIIQGAHYEDLRKRSCEEILSVGFDAYAIGGVSVGEPVPVMFETLNWVVPQMPADKPRYFMGIGLPDQIVQAVGEGIDMFDTCIPTRYGRHGTVFSYKGRYILRNSEYAKDFTPLDERCACSVCKRYTKSYLRHLFNAHELTALRLISYHNLYFYVNLMREIREAIRADNYAAFRKKFLTEYGSELLKSN